MIFDNVRAVVNSYGQNGRMIHETFYDKDDDISGFLALADRLKKLARPLRIKR